LGAPGVVGGVDVETTHFKGNFPESRALDICDLGGLGSASELEQAPWQEVLAPVGLEGDAHNWFAIERATKATHVRLRILPDGGVARLRAYGEVSADWARPCGRGQIDLAAAGGVVLACSDMFFGSRHNVIMPGDARSMADGWETRRRRGPGHDWRISCRRRRSSRTRGTHSSASSGRLATSRTRASTFFTMAASGACGCSGGPGQRGTAWRSGSLYAACRPERATAGCGRRRAPSLLQLDHLGAADGRAKAVCLGGRGAADCRRHLAVARPRQLA